MAEAHQTATVTDDKTNTGKVAEFLTAPRKKRKKYVVTCLGESFDPQLAGTIRHFIKTSFQQLKTSHPKTVVDMRRNFGRSIQLLLLDDEFADLDQILTQVRVVKEKRHPNPVPVLFLTRDPKRLIEAYHDQLFVYQESDDYFHYDRVPANQTLAAIKTSIESGSRRRSRRYKVDLDVTFRTLTHEAFRQGKLVDLSMHGALIATGADWSFKAGDQLVVSIPISRYFTPENGDFLRLPALVRRVQISGSTAAISFEHLSEVKVSLLTRFLMALVSEQMEHAMRRAKWNAPTKSNS